MPGTVLPGARLRLTLIESTRPTTLYALGAELVGVGVYAVIFVVAIVGSRVLNRIQSLAPSDQAVTFLAPRRQSSPPPAREAIQFIGLGGVSAVPIPVVTTTSNSPTPVPSGTPGNAVAESFPVLEPAASSDKAYSEIEVDSTVKLDPSAEGPQYPPALLEAGVQGVVYARFVVDTVGRVDTASMVVLDEPHPEFVNAVRTALARMTYHPAFLRGRAVAQLVEQPFVFRITPPR